MDSVRLPKYMLSRREEVNRLDGLNLRKMVAQIKGYTVRALPFPGTFDLWDRDGYFVGSGYTEELAWLEAPPYEREIAAAFPLLAEIEEMGWHWHLVGCRGGRKALGVVPSGWFWQDCILVGDSYETLISRGYILASAVVGEARWEKTAKKASATRRPHATPPTEVTP